MKKILALSCLFLLLSVSYASACYSDFDCGIGGKCIKSDYSMDGVCNNPYGASEKRGRDRYYEDDSPKRNYGGSKAGKECYSSLDCGIGGRCIKLDNDMYGVCTD